MKKILGAATLVAGLAVASTSWAGCIRIDPTGGGNGGICIDNPASDIGSMLLKDVFGSTGSGFSGTLYAQNSYSVLPGGLQGRLTYQLSFPITSSLNFAGGGFEGHKITQSSAGTFTLFYDPNPVATVASLQDTGVGYGDKNGGALIDTLVEIASGDVTIQNATFFDISGPTTADKQLATIGALTSVAAITASTSLSLNIDITTQNRSWVTNEMVMADPLMVDMSVSTLGPKTPYDDNPAFAAAQKFGSIAADFGTGETCSAPATCVGGKVNNFRSGRLDDSDLADLQLQIAGNLRFEGDVPEPGTLAMVGMGLGLLGLRRKKAKV